MQVIKYISLSRFFYYVTTTFEFMTAAVFEAASCPRGRTKLRKLNFILTLHPHLA
jgi:hypothetical protein